MEKSKSLSSILEDEESWDERGEHEEKQDEDSQPSSPSSSSSSLDKTYLTRSQAKREEELKIVFEEKKEKVLSAFTTELRNRSRSLFFCKHDIVCVTVIEISPCDMQSLTSVRENWEKMMNASKESDKPMSHLIYWCRTKREERGKAYCLVPKKNLTSLIQGIKEGHDKLPVALEKKIKSSKAPLAVFEEFNRAVLEDFDKDRILIPNKRIHWMLQFRKNYYYDQYDVYEVDSILAYTHNPATKTRHYVSESLDENREISNNDESDNTAKTDNDGSRQVPSYHGVWITSKGKHFIKIRGTPMHKNIMCFDAADKAARYYDHEVKRLRLDQQLELNYSKDGSRIACEDTAALEAIQGFKNPLRVPAFNAINIMVILNACCLI